MPEDITPPPEGRHANSPARLHGAAKGRARDTLGNGMNSQGVVSAGPVLGVVLLVLIAIAAAVTWIGRLGLSRDVVTASLRAVAQLGVVSLLITAVLRSWWTTAAFISLMVVVAAATSARRVSTLRLGWPAILPIVAGGPPPPPPLPPPRGPPAPTTP